MSQQKALVLQSKFGEYAIVDTAIPKTAKGDILVKIIATALNPIDYMIQKYGIIVSKYPVILGNEASGTVEEVGVGVTKFSKGDKVFFQSNLTPQTATYQQYATVPASIAAKVPENISFEEATTIPVGLMTAAVGFYLPENRHGAGLLPPWQDGEGKYEGQSILIFGGASSVGQYALQLAKLSGFSPILVTASPHNADFLKSLGATHVIDRKADISAEVKKVLSSAPKIIYDAISTEDTQVVTWDILAPGGTLLLVDSPHHSLRHSGVDRKKFFGVFGSAHSQRPFSEAVYAHIHDYVASGKIKPNRVEILPGGLAGIAAGLKRHEEGKVSGVKLVAKPQETV